MAEGTHKPEHPEQTQRAQTQHTEQQSAQARAKAASEGTAPLRRAAAESGLEREGPSLATVALVGVGVAIIEPELIPGLLIGAGAVLAPKLLPALGGMVRPLFRNMVKAGYSAGMRVRETAAEVGEQVEDYVAEARAEERGHHQASAAEEHTDEEASARRRRPERSTTPAANL
jgi:hypothetical protein